MIEGNKNSISDIQTSNKGLSLLSYSKTNKLVTALYMVTDIMDKEEPLRNKLRALGVNIISDTHSPLRTSINKNIDEVLSLLDIACTVGMISEMNSSILKKEFNQLKQSVLDSGQAQLSSGPVSLADFFGKDTDAVSESNGQDAGVRYVSNKFSNNIGVQKGSTLMKALSKIEIPNRTPHVGSNKNNFSSTAGTQVRNISHNTSAGFDVLKRQRRELISKIIKANPSSGGDVSNGHSIKDIMSSLKNSGEEWGEKTLQRELVSMVNDGVLKKTGEKRWSKYFIAKN